jgi:hypothetical protein
MLNSRSVTTSAGARGRTPVQWFCLIAGGLLFLRGVSVLVTGPSFDAPGEGWHAMFHLLSGALLLAASSRPIVAYRFVLAFALAYGIVAVVGTVNGSEVFGVIPIDTRDNVIHWAYVAVALGVLAVSRPQAAGVNAGTAT